MTLDEKIFNDFEQKQELIKVEKKFIDFTIEDLQLDFVNRTKQVTQQILDFKERFIDDDGKFKTKGNKLFVIDNFFFKPIVPTLGVTPKYNAEKLGIVFDIYRLLIGRINAELYSFLPSKSHFCNFAGITTGTYNTYLRSSDENLAQVTAMIDDYFFNANITSAQMREIETVSTIFRAKTEQQKVEQAPQQTVIVSNAPNVEDIMKRVSRLKGIKEAITSEKQ